MLSRNTISFGFQQSIYQRVFLSQKSQVKYAAFCIDSKKGIVAKRVLGSIKGKTASSTEWLRRQFSDPYVRKAHDEGLPSRAAFKLSEIDDKYFFLSPGKIVIDLGAAPGGWSKISSQRVNAFGEIPDQKRGVVISVDLHELHITTTHAILGDFMEESTRQQILEFLKERKADVLLSDMAPSATGQRDIDRIQKNSSRVSFQGSYRFNMKTNEVVTKLHFL